MRYLFSLLAVLAVSLASVPSYAQQDDYQIWEDRIVMRLEADALERLRDLIPELAQYSDEELNKAIYDLINAKIDKEQFPLPNSESATIQEGGLPWQTAADLIDSIARYIAVDMEVRTTAPPTNDLPTSLLWGVYGTHGVNVSGGVNGETDDGWDVSTGDPSVVVAVIDTGIDYNHPDLAANMWTNPGEIPGNNIDDDGNGVIDDVYGYNAINRGGNPWDDNDHGTHCAGTIAAVGNNNAGVVGVAYNARLMGVKFLSASGGGSYFNSVLAIDYVVKQKRAGVNVVITSNSWGGGGYYAPLFDKFAEAEAEGIVNVAAAGNSNSNNDNFMYTPGGFSNTIAVASITSSGSRSSFSSYGKNSVELGAPGSSVYSTTPNGGYKTFSGTSMATPHVAGVLALIKSTDPSLSVAQTKSALLDNTRPLGSMANTTITGGVADAGRALSELNPNEPPQFVSPIPDQSFDATPGSATITAGAYDPDGNGDQLSPVESCSAVATGAVSDQAWEFNQLFQPFCATVGCQEGVFNEGTKRVYGQAGQIFELNEFNELYRVDSGSNELIGTFEGAFEDPSVLTDPAGPPVAQSITASCEKNGDSNGLIINTDWGDAFSGSYTITVTITDNKGATANDSFSVTVTSEPPVLGDIEDQSYELSDQTGTVTLSASDPDGDAVTCSAEISAESALPPFANFFATYEPTCMTANCEFGNSKLLLGKNGEYLIINSNDTIFRHHLGSSVYVGIYSGAFNDPTILTSPLMPITPSSVSASIEGTALTLDFSNATTGTFTTTVTCSSRGGSISRQFQTSINETAHTFAPIADQVTYPGETLSLALNISNGEGVTSTSASFATDPNILAGSLASQYSLFYYDWLNDGFGYEGARWVFGTAYLRLQKITDSHGRSFTAVYTNFTDILLAVLPGSYYDDPYSFIDAPSASPHGAMASVDGINLDVSIPASYRKGTIPVLLLSQKAHFRISRFFYIDVDNTVPQLSFTAYHERSGINAGVTTPVVASDPDGQTLTVAIESVVDAAAELSSMLTSLQLEERASGHNGAGFSLWSAAQSRWYFLVPITGNESGGCDLRKDSATGTKVAGPYPSSYCSTVDGMRTLFLAQSTSLGNPTASLSDQGSGNYSLTINQNGSRLVRVTIFAFDGVEYYLGHIFLRSTNRAPLITGPTQQVTFSGSPTSLNISINDPDGDTLTHSISGELCSVAAQRLVSDYGLTRHSNCSAGSNNCAADGRKMLYSTVRRAPVYLRAEGSEASVSLSSDGSNEIGRFPASYYHIISKLLEPSFTGGSAPVVTITNTTGGTTGATTTTSQDACVSFQTTDGDYTSRAFWTVVITSATNEFGDPVIDSDRDGRSDTQEAEDGTDPFDRGHASTKLESPAYAHYTQISESAVFVTIQNNDPGESTSGTITVLDHEGVSLTSQAFTVNADSIASFEMLSDATLEEDITGLVKIDFSGGDVRGQVEVSGSALVQASRRVISSTTFTNPTNATVTAPFSEGRVADGAVSCDLDECRSDLVLYNAGTSTETVTIKVYNSDGAMVHETSATLTPFVQAEPIDLEEIEEADLLGSFTVTPNSSNAQILTYAEHTGFNGTDAHYQYVTHGALGSGHSRETVLSGVIEEESSAVSLLNVLSGAVDARLSVFSSAGTLLLEETHTLAAHARTDIEFSDVIPTGETAVVLIEPNEKGSLIAFGEHSYDTEDSHELHLSQMATRSNETIESLSLWQRLKARIPQASEGEVEEGAGLEQIAAGETIAPTIEAVKESGGMSLTLIFLTDEGVPIVGVNATLFRVRRGKQRDTGKSDITDSTGSVTFTEVKRKGRYLVKLSDDNGEVSSTRFKGNGKSKKRCKKRKRRCQQ